MGARPAPPLQPHPKYNQRVLGSAFAATASLLVGLSVIATRVVVAPPRAIDPLLIALLRNVTAVLCMATVVGLTSLLRRPEQTADSGLPRRQDWLALSLLGVPGFCLFPYLFTAALQHAGAGQAALVLPTTPMLTLLLAASLGRERLTLRRLAGIVTAGVGVCVALGATDPGASASQIALDSGALMLAAAASSAIYNVFAPPFIVRHGASRVVLVGMIAGTLGLALLALPGLSGGLPYTDMVGWGAILFVGMASAAVNWLWAEALRLMPSSNVAVFTTLNPVAAALGAAAFMGEPLTVTLLAGFALVAAGIMAVNVTTRRSR